MLWWKKWNSIVVTYMLKSDLNVTKIWFLLRKRIFEAEINDNVLQNKKCTPWSYRFHFNQMTKSLKIFYVLFIFLLSKKIPSLDRCGRDKIQTFLINKEILKYFLSIVLISCFYELSITRQMGTRQNSDMGKICLLFVLISDRFKNWLCLFMVPLK